MSDVLQEHDWAPDFHAEETMASLRATLDAAIAIASAFPTSHG